MPGPTYVCMNSDVSSFQVVYTRVNCLTCTAKEIVTVQVFIGCDISGHFPPHTHDYDRFLFKSFRLDGGSGTDCFVDFVCLQLVTVSQEHKLSWLQ